jgi:hypothetical protein
MGGPVKASTARTTALLAVVLCTLALLAPTTAMAATGKVDTGIHLVKVVTANATHPHVLNLRLDQPHVLSAGGRPSVGWAFEAATGRSATIARSCTADSPRMRGPPAHGCS